LGVPVSERGRNAADATESGGGNNYEQEKKRKKEVQVGRCWEESDGSVSKIGGHTKK